MKILKAFLYCLLWFTLAFLVMYISKYKEENSYRESEIISMNVETGVIMDDTLPIFESFTLSYLWDSKDSMYNCYDSSNLAVKASVSNATVKNGMISKLVFYYYNVDDPNRILDYKETLISNPYVYFSIPKIWYEYKFWVKLYDNKGWMIDSEELLSGNPSLHLPSCTDADTPIVTLKLSDTDVRVWDAITYSVVSRIPLNDEDSEKNIIFYYDFTGDWTWDLITWNNIVDYTFEEPFISWVTPRVAVEYRWKLWIWDGAKIFVSGYETDGKSDNDVKGNNMSEYEIMKMEIIAIIQETTIKWNIRELFLQFEGLTSLEEKAAILERIFEVVIEDGGLGMYDKRLVQNEFCSIVEYYNLSNYTELCKIPQDYYSEIYRG